MANDDRGFGVGPALLAFFLGGLVGAGVALLVAPASGKETRKKIKDFTEDAKERAESYMDDIKTKATSYVDKGKEYIDEKKSVISKAVEAGKDAYHKEKEKIGTE